MGPDDIIRSPHAKAPLRALPAAPPSPLLDIKTNVRPIPMGLPYSPHEFKSLVLSISTTTFCDKTLKSSMYRNVAS